MIKRKTMQEVEIWKDVEGYTGKYRISNHGKLMYKRGGIYHVTTGRLHPVLGYREFTLTKDGTTKWVYAHRLVGEYFLKNPKMKPIIHHLDHDRENNHVDNLVWATYSENIIFASMYGRLGKLNGKDVKKIRSLCKKGVRQCKVAEMYNVTPGSISHIMTGRSWRYVA